MRLRDFGDGADAALLHHELEFYSEEIYYAFYSGLTECSQAPDVGAANADCAGSQCEVL